MTIVPHTNMYIYVYVYVYLIQNIRPIYHVYIYIYTYHQNTYVSHGELLPTFQLDHRHTRPRDTLLYCKAAPSVWSLGASCVVTQVTVRSYSWLIQGIVWMER